MPIIEIDKSVLEEIADVIVADNNSEGVLEAINKYILI